MIKIALCGIKGAGKNTVANYLEEILKEQGYSVGQFALADKVREYAAILNPIVGSAIKTRYSERDMDPSRGTDYVEFIRYNEALKTYGYDVAKIQFPEIRRQLQRIGTELFRDQVDRDYWVKILMKDLKACPPEVALITDVRFPNEGLSLILAEGRTIGIIVTRPGFVSDGHASENPDEVFRGTVVAPYYIHNDGDLDNLKSLVQDLVDDLKEFECL